MGRPDKLAQWVSAFFAMLRTDFDVGMRVAKDLSTKMREMTEKEGRAGLREVNELSGTEGNTN